MKIKEIKRSERDRNHYIVIYKPNFIERLFDVKEKQMVYKDTGAKYKYGNQTVYIGENGKCLENGSHIAEMIDIYKRKVDWWL